MSLTEKKVSGRLAIIGCGSSGLISLKKALDALPGWHIECFEKSASITGCWGHPYPGFVSTSTKYTTQFASLPKFKLEVKPDGGRSYSEFFREGEYGQYLETFADEFNLRPHIRLQTKVTNLRRSASNKGWTFSVIDSSTGDSTKKMEEFDQVIIATGLAATPKPLECSASVLSPITINSFDGIEQINNKKIVIIGGGESAVDYAERLSRPSLKNEVFLSLNSGIRVSPRYHPIRGVPSDFLRNRLMLSIHPDLRNKIGHYFVRGRIRYQEIFESWFPQSGKNMRVKEKSDKTFTNRRKYWADKLTQTAKDDLFRMFHNKSDTFLDAVADQRIKIIGQSIDPECKVFRKYDSDCTEKVEPDFIVPAIGYRSLLTELTKDSVKFKDFHLGCTHVEYSDLHLVGFARPIIGNIPSISEVQAEFICNMIAGKISLPENLKEVHERNYSIRQERYGKLNHESVYPVEMFPYCDHLSKLTGSLPNFSFLKMRAWFRKQLSPATTLYYGSPDSRKDKIYMPAVLILLLIMLLPLNLIYLLRKREECSF